MRRTLAHGVACSEDIAKVVQFADLRALLARVCRQNSARSLPIEVMSKMPARPATVDALAAP
ncbi:MAG: hypothetical protein ACKVQU_37400 [Burkholderiales bacterium]